MHCVCGGVSFCLGRRVQKDMTAHSREHVYPASFHADGPSFASYARPCGDGTGCSSDNDSYVLGFDAPYFFYLQLVMACSPPWLAV